MTDEPFLSVVIATLGAKTLPETIRSLNSGSVVPDEIILSIPEEVVWKSKYLQSGNVEVFSVQVRGQVAQRYEGFKIARGKFVLQSDDDVIFDKDCIYSLIEACKSKGSKSACSPALYFLNSVKSVYVKPVSSKFLSTLYYGILNGCDGYREGTITLAGTEIGVDHDNHIEQIILTEWIPGGVALHYKENLVLENYYPHDGKAFSEDLYHSIELKKRGIKLFIVIPAVAWIDDPRTANISNLYDWYNTMRMDYKARKHFVQTNKLSLLRMNFFYAAAIFATFFKKISQI